MKEAASFGQGLAIAARVAECFPRDIPQEDVQVMIDDPEFWRGYLAGAREAFAARVPTIPEIGVEFELTLDGNAPENQPLEMVRKSGGYHLTEWKHKGPVVAGQQTRRFKLVQVGYQPNLDAVKKALALHGDIPEGQWREAFKRRFRRPDGKGHIGIADSSWVDPDGTLFPYVHTDGRSDFDRAGGDLGGYWRWLVGVRK